MSFTEQATHRQYGKQARAYWKTLIRNIVAEMQKSNLNESHREHRVQNDDQPILASSLR